MLALILLWTRHTKTFFKKYTHAKYKNMCRKCRFDGFKPTITTKPT